MAPPWSGGVMVIIWAVNSSSKYLVSVSDVTWGLKGGLSCGGNGRFQAALRAPHPAPTAAPRVPPAVSLGCPGLRPPTALGRRLGVQDPLPLERRG